MKSTVNLLVLMLVFFGSYLEGFGQTNVNVDTIKAGWGNLDYVVPESPAFKLLGTQPTDILRPTSVRAVAVSVGNYLLNNGAGVIPKNISVELSPLVFSPNLDLKEYNKNIFLYRSRLSLGTNVKDDGSYDIAGGLNFTVVDETDKRSNKNPFLAAAMRMNVQREDIRALVISEYANARSVTIQDATLRSIENRTLGDSLNSEISKRYLAISVDGAKTLSEYHKNFSKQHWNACIVQIGMAGKLTSKDSLIEGINKSFQYGIWGTAGIPIKSNGQILIGLSVGGKRNLEGKFMRPDISLGARFYYGKNELKGYLEAEEKGANDWETNIFTVKGGLELRLEKGYWIDLGFAFQNTKQGTRMVPAFNIKYAIPDLKK